TRSRHTSYGSQPSRVRASPLRSLAAPGKSSLAARATRWMTGNPSTPFLFILRLLPCSAVHSLIALPGATPGVRSLSRPQRERSESTRLNSSHLGISYAVFCLNKKTIIIYTKNIQNDYDILRQIGVTFLAR